MSSQRDKALALVERFGSQRGDPFAPAGMPLDGLAQRFGTPFYLYHGEMIVDRARRIRDALGTELLYSVKANPSLALCQLIGQESGVGAEVASSGELAVAMAAGFDPADIVFAGPGKTDDELERIVMAGIFADHVESLTEIERLARVAGAMGRRIGVGLRIDPPGQLMGSQMRMGGTGGQFGIDHADLGRAVQTTLAHPELILRGIHVYTATQIFDPDPLVEHCRAILDIAIAAAEEAGAPLELVDLGGGFGVPYFERLAEFDLQRFARGFRDLRLSYRSAPGLRDTRLAFELGRYLVADAGIYVTRVVDVKDVRGKLFAITDGGMNHHLTATGNMGQVFRKSFPMLDLSRLEEEDDGSVAVTGPLCTPLDTFGTDLLLPRPRVGDLMGVFYSGAYGYSASNLGFLSHPTPAEVLLWQGAAHLLRAGGRPEDVLSGQRALPADPLP